VQGYLKLTVSTVRRCRNGHTTAVCGLCRSHTVLKAQFDIGQSGFLGIGYLFISSKYRALNQRVDSCNLNGILREMDVPFFDPLLIIEKTNGRMAGDNQWVQMIRNIAA